MPRPFVPYSSRARSSRSSSSSSASAARSRAAAQAVAAKPVVFASWRELREAILGAARHVRRASAKRDHGLGLAWEGYLARLLSEGEPMISQLTPRLLVSHFHDQAGIIMTAWPALFDRLTTWDNSKPHDWTRGAPTRTTASVDSWIRELVRLTIASPQRAIPSAAAPLSRAQQKQQAVETALHQLLRRLIRRFHPGGTDRTTAADQLWLHDVLTQYSNEALRLASVVTAPPGRGGKPTKALAEMLARGGPVIDPEWASLLLQRTRQGFWLFDGPAFERWMQSEVQLQQAIAQGHTLWPEHAGFFAEWAQARRSRFSLMLAGSFDTFWTGSTPDAIGQALLDGADPSERPVMMEQWGRVILGRELRTGGVIRTGTGGLPRDGTQHVQPAVAPPLHPLEIESIAVVAASPASAELLQTTTLSDDLVVRWLQAASRQSIETFHQVASWVLAVVPAGTGERLLRHPGLLDSLQRLPQGLRPWLRQTHRGTRLAAIQLAGQIGAQADADAAPVETATGLAVPGAAPAARAGEPVPQTQLSSRGGLLP